MEKIKAHLIGGKVSSNSIEAQNLFASQRFGEKIGEKIFYLLPEALFLIKTKKLEIYDKNKILSEEESAKKFERLDKKFMTKYLVFKDLRKKGYILKSALKFGAEFRVYEKGKTIGKDHARWLVQTVFETDKLSMHEFSAKNRVAHTTKKNLLIAIVDEEGSVSYYEISWIKP